MTLKSPQRRVLGAIDSNKTPTGKTCGAEKKVSTPVPAYPAKNDRKSQKQILEEKRADFDVVCKFRIGEDLDGDLCDHGIQEWDVDDFDYVKKLGSGGAAKVYCVTEKQSGYPLALKVQEANESAICELDVHLTLDHPNVVKMFDYFYSFKKIGPTEDYETPEDGSQTLYMYIILEVCNGGSLHEEISYSSADCALEEPEAAMHFMKALESLEYLHSQGVIHCDIKPANFLLHEKQLKLADFGMAVRDDEKEIIGGSPIYMSPEHLTAWRCMTTDFDHRVDIYSLGVMLYEMLFGYLPYEVIEDKEENSEDSSTCTDALVAGFANATLEDDPLEGDFPVLDLRKLNDKTSNEPFYIPPPIFDEEISEEAEDLIMGLMEPSRDLRITLSEAKKHPWFKKHLK